MRTVDREGGEKKRLSFGAGCGRCFRLNARGKGKLEKP